MGVQLHKCGMYAPMKVNRLLKEKNLNTLRIFEEGEEF